MDAELVELQKQLEFAQQAKSSIRLSERNVVELVQKLQELNIIDYDLLHTVSGKEYITPEQLRVEMVGEIIKCGRVSIIDLADMIGVDLYHIETQVKHIIAHHPDIMFTQGEVITRSYWDTVTQDINERLQECSHISLAELAAQFHIASDLFSSVLETRLGTIVKGRLEGGQLYTPAYVARVYSMVRGASRALTVPTNLSIVWNSLQQLLQEVDGATGIAVETTFFHSLFNALLKEGGILGSIRAGLHWTPSVFAHAQKETVDSFFSQNSYISYDALHKLAIPQPKQFLQSRYPKSIPLDTVFVHPSMIEMLDAAAEDAIEQDSWVDAFSVLPALFGTQDASKLLSFCPSVQRALKSSTAVIIGDACVVSSAFVKDVFKRIEKEMGNPFDQGINENMHVTNEAKVRSSSDKFVESNAVGVESGGNKYVPEKGSKKKRGKAVGNSKTGTTDGGNNEQENLPTKTKKNQRKIKDQVSDAKSGARKDTDKAKMDNHNIFSEEWIIEKILMLVPEFDGLGGVEDPHLVLAPLATHLRPMLLTSWEDKRKALLNENAERMRHLRDNLQKKVDETFLNMQLNEKALDLFEDDPATSVILHKHLLRTATSIVDTLLRDLDILNKLKNGIEVEELHDVECDSLSSGERMSLAKGLTGSLSIKALAVVETLEGKRVENFMTALRLLAEESGLVLKKLDKKLERTLLHSYRKDLTSQISAETDPVALLPKVVSLLYLQVHNKALQAPGRAISIAVLRLKDKLEDAAYKILIDYHTATVTLLALLSSATDNEGCTSDRFMSKREYLESLMPKLKGLVISESQS